MKSKFHQFLFSSILLAALISCGDEGGDETNIIINPDVPQLEEGPVDTGGTVIINRFDPDIKVSNKNVFVDKVTKIIRVKYIVEKADPVPHQQVIYPAISCNVILNLDINQDSVIERKEIEQELGNTDIPLSEASGASYEFTQDIPLEQFTSGGTNRFIVVVYGSRENPDYPVACFPFNLNIDTNGNGTETNEDSP
jgi:hypothetical protein